MSFDLKGKIMVKSIFRRRLAFSLLRIVLLFSATALFLRIWQLATDQAQAAAAINQAGFFRCSSQRLVKQELADQKNEELKSFVSDMISQIHSEEGVSQFPVISKDDYRDLVDELKLVWDRLSGDIERFNKKDATGDDEKILIDDSESYFKLSDDLVNRLQIYSESLSERIKTYLSLLFGILVFLVILAFFELLLTSRQIKELGSLAFRDGLTGLQNRYAADRYMMALGGASSNHIGAAIFDLNNLKAVNDRFGHSAGDDLIRRFAEVLARFNDPHVFISRNGGDEFLLIAEKKNETEFRRLLTSIDDALRRENDNNPDETAISYAVGSAFGGGSVYALAQEADRRMYVRKQEQKRDNAFPASAGAAD